MTQSPPLFSLPIELHKDILDLLPYPTLQILRATHPHFRTLIDLDKVRKSTPRKDLIDEMVAAYRYDAFRRLERMPPCRECLRFRPKGEFADSVLHKKQPERWFCIQCGIDHIYQPGTEIWCGGKAGVWCKMCRIYKSGAEHTVMHGGPFCRVCEWALKGRKFTPDRVRLFHSHPNTWRHYLMSLRSRVPEPEEARVSGAGGRQSEA